MLDKSTFADDAHSAASSKKIDVIVDSLNSSAQSYYEWTEQNGMEISAAKTTVTLFTPWTAQVNKKLPVGVNGQLVRTVKEPTLLGVKLDPTFTFSAHAKAVARKAASRMNLIRALADTSFGKDSDLLIRTYKCYIRSLFDYAAPITFPNYSPSSIDRFQRIQNRAFRLALGVHSASAVDFLHAEAKELLVSDHLRLLSAQFLAKCLQPSHPSHDVVLLDKGYRQDKKETLRSSVFHLVEPYVNDQGIIAPGTYQATIKAIHTDIVSEAVDRLAPNRVLQQRPPLVHPINDYLPRETQCALRRLRSGFSISLRDYQLRIGNIADDLCPDCGTEPQSVRHLFNCPAFPTRLAVDDIWENPWDTAEFLRSTPSFSFLPDPGPRPSRASRRGRRRRPPPEPPPLIMRPP